MDPKSAPVKSEMLFAILFSLFCLVLLGVGWREFGRQKIVILPQRTEHDEGVTVPIFVYHSVRPYMEGESKEQDAFDVTPELLKQELTYLQENHYTEITFDALADYFARGTSLPEKPVILSFDDGWQNQYLYAFPLLKEFNATSTFFIFTNSINSKNFLTLAEIKEIEAAGMVIGAHSKSHPYLDKITDVNKAADEILGSKQILEKDLGHEVTAFAYPFGHPSELSQGLVEEAGFRTARTLFHGTIHRKSDLFALKSYLATDNFDEFVRVLKNEVK